jgi:hypothetical protein
MAKPNPSCPDAHAGMKNDPVADEGMGHGHVGGKGTVTADLDVGADDRMRSDQGAGADFSMRPDDGARVHLDAVFQPGGWMHEGAWRDSCSGKGRFRPHGRGKQDPEHLREDPVGLRRYDCDRLGRHLCSIARGDKTGRGLGGAESAHISGVVHVGKIAGTGALERSHPMKQKLPVDAVGERCVGHFRHLTQIERLALREEVRFCHG